MTQVVALAASNGDRSENATIIRKRRLRQTIGASLSDKADRSGAVVDPEAREAFSRRCRFLRATSFAPWPTERLVSIVGVDEVDLLAKHQAVVAAARAL